MKDPVFIIGGSRTGSEMLKTMLSASTDLDFVDELFLLCPRWLHRDLDGLIRARVGEISSVESRERLVDLLYSGEPYGWVWGKASEKFDRDVLRDSLDADNLDLKAILDALMEAHAAVTGKTGRGAKFPMHFGYSARLLEWYPDCRLVHTTRDPRAVYASQANKYVTDADPVLAKSWMKFRQFAHINLQVSWTARVHRQLRKHPNYMLVRYEDVVQDPEGQIRQLCQFLNVEFVPAMLAPKQYGSSFGKIGKNRGVDRSSLTAWRKLVHPVTANILRGLHPIAWRRFGYQE
jgi:hypothetical protein